ncbi:MAG: hypothetical protein KatS3mg076_2201 [Candidatus Binatia bacterium]|nr:MAG: hypothetical protein KatS3mg076_2201 [Candidatus Binatia bacterium]
MARGRNSSALGLFRLVLALAFPVLAAPVAATTITIVNLDGAGEGLNDPTPRGPEGGNPGTTLGELRRNAFQEAANRWAAVLRSSVPIEIEARFDPLFCSGTTALLGSAGPNTVHRDFPGAPFPNTWFVQATANSIAGTDLSSAADGDVEFNSSLDEGCLSAAPNGWYYGFDGNPGPGQLDFLGTALHELAHILGFLTLVDLETGAKFNGRDDTFMRNLEDHATGKLFPVMSDAERASASVNTGNLHWVGPNVKTASVLLSAGKTGDHVHMYAPDPVEPGSSVSHFDTTLDPDELMEPFENGSYIQDLTEALFADIGWALGPSPTPTATATPTATPTPTPLPPPPPLCPATPQPGCLSPGKSTLFLRDLALPSGDPDRRDRLVWKWLRGPALDFADLGNPVGNQSSYTLCAYDEVGGVPALFASFGVPSDGICRNGKPCWKRLGKAANPLGYRYRDPDVLEDGILKIVLKSGADGKSKVLVVGKTGALPLPGPLGETYLAQDQNVVVQLLKSDGGVCWESRYPAPAKKNTEEVFRETCGTLSTGPC